MNARTRIERTDRGFALSWVVLMLALLALVAAAGFLLSLLEVRSARRFASGVEAFHAADGALREAVATTAGTPPALRSLAVGRAAARVRFSPILRLTTGEALYRVVASSRLVEPGGDTIRRSVETVVWAADPIRPVAAVTSAGEIRGASATGTVTGQDATPACGGAFGMGIAGVSLPAGAVLSAPGVWIDGQPPISRWTAGTTVRTLAGLDWVDLVGPDGPARDAVVPPDPWPAAGGVTWPVIELAAPVARLGPAHAGAGTLIVRGDLELDAGFAWRGLVLAGGAIRALGDLSIEGAVLAGLDSTRVAPPVVDLEAAAVWIAFDSCAVRAAAARIAPSAAEHPGTWREIF
ncbi:MAG: hypothetical protein ACRELC_01260 [Gemmatimonadota bacterium]